MSAQTLSEPGLRESLTGCECRSPAPPAALKQARGVRPESQAQVRRHGTGQKGMSASGAMPRLVGVRSADMRRAELPPATAATHAPNRDPTTPREKAWAKLMARVGEEFPFACPWVWWRHPAGAGPRRTGGSQAGEGQDGFARVQRHLRQSRRPARRAVSRPVCANAKNPALSADRKLLGTSTIGPHQARPAPAVAPHDPPHSANACRSAIGRLILHKLNTLAGCGSPVQMCFGRVRSCER